MTTPHKALLIQARAALQAIGSESVCQASHHSKKDQHTGLSPCPVVARHQDAIAALTAAIDAPEPEPVAWRFDRPGISKLDAWPHGGEWEPLYLHPASREPLSDAEIDAAWRSVDYQASYDQFRRDVGRAIEAAHGIGAKP